MAPPGGQFLHQTKLSFLLPIDRYNLEPQTMGFFSEYDINTNPGTANSVSTAAFRFVASLLPGIIQYYDNKGQRVKVESFSDAFYKPDGLYEAGMLDHIFRGMIKSHTQVRAHLIAT